MTDNINLNDFELPISEEMLGAYLEGNLLDGEALTLERAIERHPYLGDLMNSVVDSADLAENEIPIINDNDINDLIVDITEDRNDDVPQKGAFPMENLGEVQSSILKFGTAINEAQKQYGLEPQNIDFDPDTYQWNKDTCAIRSQEIVLRSFGTFVPQEELIKQAQQHGWYSPGEGTTLNDVGNLLDLYGVPNHRVADANVFNLVDELGKGHKVIVGVDIDELYGNSFWQSIKENLVGKTPNHAMLVSGIDTSDPIHSKVILTDPGTGKTLFECPYDKFLSAWNDSKCYMVATNEPAPLIYNQDTMINFDYQTGHVPFLGDMPFGEYSKNVVPNAESYLHAIDEYIDALDKTITTDFKDMDLYDDMMHKASIVHHETVDLHTTNKELTQSDDCMSNKSSLDEEIGIKTSDIHEFKDDADSSLELGQHEDNNLDY